MASENFCEFCQRPVVHACADPDVCILGHKSTYVAWQDGNTPPAGKYRVQLQNGAWRDAESIWENGEFMGFDYRVGLWEWLDRSMVGYVAVKK